MCNHEEVVVESKVREVYPSSRLSLNDSERGLCLRKVWFDTKRLWMSFFLIRNLVQSSRFCMRPRTPQRNRFIYSQWHVNSVAICISISGTRETRREKCFLTHYTSSNTVDPMTDELSTFIFHSLNRTTCRLHRQLSPLSRRDTDRRARGLDYSFEYWKREFLAVSYFILRERILLLLLG